MFGVNKNSILLISFILIVVLALNSQAAFYKKTPPRVKYRSLISKWANSLVERFGLNGVDEAQFNRRSSKNSCNTIESIEDYFFRVYAENAERQSDNITLTGLDDLIDYQIHKHRTPKLETLHHKHKCNRQKCFTSLDIAEITNFTTINKENFARICPVLLYNLEMEECSTEVEDKKPLLEPYKKWLIGLTFATIVTLWSWIGGLVLPIMSRPIYKKVLTGMLSLACGCVLSNSLLNFIPRADGIDHVDVNDPNTFFFKHLLVLGVIFFFFNFERTMKLIAFYKKEKADKKKQLEEPRASVVSYNTRQDSVTNDRDNNSVSATMPATAISEISEEPKRNTSKPKPRMKKSPSIDIGDIHVMGISSVAEIADRFAATAEKINHPDNLVRQSSTSSESFDVVNEDRRICCTSLTKGLSKVRPIGWMAIFGDGLSNFIDGLSIGAGINQGITEGLTVAIAAWFGNIPQELGDFALLIRAGMTPFQALFYNYLSALGCYIGFIVGCIAGESINVARWIFALSGATTMYIGLAVLLPEIVEEFEDVQPFSEKVRITIIQIAGLVLGYTILTVLNVYEESISI